MMFEVEYSIEYHGLSGEETAVITGGSEEEALDSYFMNKMGDMEKKDGTYYDHTRQVRYRVIDIRPIEGCPA